MKEDHMCKPKLTTISAAIALSTGMTIPNGQYYLNIMATTDRNGRFTGINGGELIQMNIITIPLNSIELDEFICRHIATTTI
jgi:hypothetical protein